ncbi:P1 family peptidase [Anaerosphaera multitolerans]|uniref:S58 family peptidase n=1 Tax=Anaerosphaera multitolerans TaxID=2487351 RepID=A0A437S565_9FIRM|nr:P1 family peptidase [Anaerosphaera multitolerans]RVU54150.1 S58 family peptidase [Anaerosphaera multitolerans]
MGIYSKKYTFGKYKKGLRNKITDVKGVKVGHVTLDSGPIKTGVTAILPHGGNTYKEKVIAACSVLNGFGKSVGLVQIEELGTLESPIIMTNTLSVGTALTASIKYMMEENPDMGANSGATNCVVTECNDGVLNDMRGLHITEEHVIDAIKNASEDFEEGSIGAGRGMISMNLKSGIGSSSRIVQLDDEEYTIGTLVLSNTGTIKNFRICGESIGEMMYNARKANKKEEFEKGSIIIVIATDIPANDRQLKRIANRASIALGRVGSYMGHGSGDIAIAFSTSNKIYHDSEKTILNTKMLDDDKIDTIFNATVDSIEESIVSSIIHSVTTKGRNDKVIYSLKDNLSNLGMEFEI